MDVSAASHDIRHSASLMGRTAIEKLCLPFADRICRIEADGFDAWITLRLSFEKLIRVASSALSRMNFEGVPRVALEEPPSPLRIAGDSPCAKLISVQDSANSIPTARQVVSSRWHWVRHDLLVCCWPSGDKTFPS